MTLFEFCKTLYNRKMNYQIEFTCADGIGPLSFESAEEVIEEILNNGALDTFSEEIEKLTLHRDMVSIRLGNPKRSLLDTLVHEDSCDYRELQEAFGKDPRGLTLGECGFMSDYYDDSLPNLIHYYAEWI